MMKIFYLPKNVQSIRALNIISVFFILGTLSGCATGSTIITGTKRTAIDPNEVKIYLDPPTEYESIGIIEVSSNVGFSRQKAQDKAMDALKSRAAKVGANGVLLTNTGSQSVGTTGYYSNGVFYGGGSSNKMLAQGRAIYVIPK